MLPLVMPTDVCVWCAQEGRQAGRLASSLAWSVGRLTDPVTLCKACTHTHTGTGSGRTQAVLTITTTEALVLSRPAGCWEIQRINHLSTVLYHLTTLINLPLQGSKLRPFSMEPNCIFKNHLQVLCIETNTFLGSLQKFEGAAGGSPRLPTPPYFELCPIFNHLTYIILPKNLIPRMLIWMSMKKFMPIFQYSQYHHVQ